MKPARRILGILLILTGLYVAVAIGGRATRITCAQVETDQVNCTSQPAPLGIPVGEIRTIPDVRAAIARDYEGLGRTYTLELETAQGTISLNRDMTVNEEAAAARINAFLETGGADPLVITDVDWSNLIVGVVVVGGILGIYPGLYLLLSGPFGRRLARRVPWRLVFGVACMAFGAFCLFIFGRVTIITCSHVTTGRTDCRQQDTWAGWMPLDAPTTIRNLTEAEPDRRRSSNPYPNEFSSYTFHLKLKDEEGAITASECFTYPQAKRLAETLNTFLADPEADSVTVHTLHWASAVLGFISTIVPNFVLGGLLLHRWPRHTA